MALLRGRVVDGVAGVGFARVRSTELGWLLAVVNGFFGGMLLLTGGFGEERSRDFSGDFAPSILFSLDDKVDNLEDCFSEDAISS